jgi:protein gp37
VFAERFRDTPGHPYENGFDLRLVPERLGDPLQRKKPALVFVNSMSDLFHEGIPDDYLDRCFAVMDLAKQHTYQILTKRSRRMVEYLSERYRKVPDHIWCGVSVEDVKYGVPRIANLRKTPARMRFLSIEPLLEDLCELNLSGIGWVIVGAESGRNARPMKLAWVEAIKRQCDRREVPFFMKQWCLNGKPLHVSRWPPWSRVRMMPDGSDLFDSAPSPSKGQLIIPLATVEDTR